jgi:hypothetical protein
VRDSKTHVLKTAGKITVQLHLINLFFFKFLSNFTFLDSRWEGKRFRAERLRIFSEFNLFITFSKMRIWFINILSYHTYLISPIF